MAGFTGTGRSRLRPRRLGLCPVVRLFETTWPQSCGNVSGSRDGSIAYPCRELLGESRNSTNNASPPATQALSDAPRRLQDGSAFAAKPTQRLLDIRTAAAEPQTVRPALNLIGRVIADPNRSSIVQSIYGGRVIPSEGAIPRIGQRSARATFSSRSNRICLSRIARQSWKRSARSNS